VAAVTAQSRRGCDLSVGGRQLSFIRKRKTKMLFSKKPTSLPTKADAAAKLSADIQAAAAAAQQSGLSMRAIADTLERLAETWNQSAVMSAPSSAQGHSVAKMAALIGGLTR
jgi:hypothetical protein